MKYYIVASGEVGEVDLHDGLAGKFYKRVQQKYDDYLIIQQSGARTPALACIRIARSNLSALKNNAAIFRGWKQGAKWWGRYKWNSETAIWDKIKCLNTFFREQYSYVTPIYIIPESIIPDGSYDFFEQPRGSNNLIEEVVRIAQAVQAAHKTVLPPSNTHSQSTSANSNHLPPQGGVAQKIPSSSGSSVAQTPKQQITKKVANEREHDRNLVNGWKARWGAILSGEEKKACDQLWQSQNNYNGAGWNKMAAKEIEDAKKENIVLKNKNGKPHDAKSLGRNIQNAANGLLKKIKAGYEPE